MRRPLDIIRKICLHLPRSRPPKGVVRFSVPGDAGGERRLRRGSFQPNPRLGRLSQTAAWASQEAHAAEWPVRRALRPVRCALPLGDGSRTALPFAGGATDQASQEEALFRCGSSWKRGTRSSQKSPHMGAG